MRDYYPPIEPYNTGFLQFTSPHSLYYEESGNPNGNPVVFLHGGPGGGTSPDDRRYFNPEKYRIILFDQRGAGKSTPSGCLENNTTQDLVRDLEILREHLNVEKWVVFGGSWGSFLALMYALDHAKHIKALILRGVFMLRASELHWFYQDGASHIFPDMWEEFIAPIPLEERKNLIPAYYKRLVGSDEKVKLECAKAWSKWECATSKLYVDPSMIAKAENDTWALAFARIESHFFYHGGFFSIDSHILDNADKIKDIPCVIVQGRYDVVCPVRSAWDLHKKLGCELVIVKDAGHSAKEPSIRSQLIECADRFATL